MKRFTFIFALLLATTTMMAERFTLGKLTFQTISATEVELVKANQGITSAYLSSTITYQGKTYRVMSIGDEAFYRCSSLTSITIPNSVTSIGDWAFYGCDGLTSPVYNAHCFAYLPTFYEGAYTIPEGIKQIVGSAFYDCTGLTSITIPNSVTSIGVHTFDNTAIFKNPTNWNNGALYINNCLISVDTNWIGDYNVKENTRLIAGTAFSDCKGLTSITIPNSVTSIGDWAFWGCSSLTSITIPNSVTSIGENAFNRCSGLRSVTLGNSVTSIEYGAFAYCDGLTSITIPNSVTSIGDYAFAWCYGLTSITIPNSVTSIGDWAFYDCPGLRSVTLGNSVTSIGDGAFMHCSSLKSIIVQNGNPIYDSRENCNAIIEKATNTLIAGCNKTIIPYSVTSIGESAFSGCYSLTSITIPNNVTSIGRRAFYWCDSLKSVILPSHTKIGEYAFPSHTQIIRK